MNGGVIFIKRKSCNSWHLQHEGLANVIFLKCGCSFCSLGVGGRYDDTTSSATHSDSWEAKYALVILFRKRKHSSRNVEWPSHNIDNYFESVFKPSKNSTANKFTPNAFGQEWVRSHVPKVLFSKYGIAVERMFRKREKHCDFPKSAKKNRVKSKTTCSNSVNREFKKSMTPFHLQEIVDKMQETTMVKAFKGIQDLMEDGETKDDDFMDPDDDDDDLKDYEEDDEDDDLIDFQDGVDKEEQSSNNDGHSNPPVNTKPSQVERKVCGTSMLRNSFQKHLAQHAMAVSKIHKMYRCAICDECFKTQQDLGSEFTQFFACQMSDL
nr:unnamed protein product [Naegleria fowleri]